MKQLRGLCKSLYSVLRQGGTYTTLELCKEIGFPIDELPTTKLYYTERVRQLIAKVRNKFIDNSATPDNKWMYVDGDVVEDIAFINNSVAGYTLDKTVEALAFQSRTRTNQSINIMLNGAPIFNDFKKLAPKAFLKFKIELAPKLITTRKLFKTNI